MGLQYADSTKRKSICLGKGFSFASDSRPQEIRYERSQAFSLADAWIPFVFHHHPGNIDELTAQADQGLRFCFSPSDIFLLKYVLAASFPDRDI